jgi:hypothetical protein
MNISLLKVEIGVDKQKTAVTYIEIKAVPNNCAFARGSMGNQTA